MACQINVTMNNSFPDPLYTLQDKAGWKYGGGCQWTTVGKKERLDMKGSGTGGALLYTSGRDTFLLAFGVHNWVMWGDVKVVDEADRHLSAFDHIARYYDDNYPALCDIRWNSTDPQPQMSRWGSTCIIHMPENKGEGYSTFDVFGQLQCAYR